MLQRGKYGVEYVSHPEDGESSGFGWIAAVIFLIALVSLGVTLVHRIGVSSGEEVPVDESLPSVQDTAPVVSVEVAEASAVEPPTKTVVTTGDITTRSPRVKNLLMRLEEAMKSGNIEMEVSTIESLRSFPGEAVADLDDRLARRLGHLNVRRLFERRNLQWVTEVTVKGGDSASRIAIEHGSTLASLLKLNTLESPDKIKVGRKLYVMDHPRFILVVHKALKVADLSLNGKFFRRYDLAGEVTSPEGNFETPVKLRAFLSEKGIVFNDADRAELETLLPAKAQVIVSAM